MSNVSKSLNKTTGMRVTFYLYTVVVTLPGISFEVCLFVVGRKNPYPKASTLYNYTLEYFHLDFNSYP